MFPAPSNTAAAWIRIGCSWATSDTDVTARAVTKIDLIRMRGIIIPSDLLMMQSKSALTVLVLAAAIVAAAAAARQAPGTTAAEQDWPFYGGDQAGTKFSPIADINRATVSHLAAAWEWSAGEKALPQFGTRPGAFEVTPLMIDNVLYFTTPYNRVVALNADTGAQLWAFDP